MKLKHLLFVGYLFISLPFFGKPSAKVYFFEIDDNIAKPAYETEKAIKKPPLKRRIYFYYDLTPLGRIRIGGQIRTLLLEAPMTTIVFIDNARS